MAALPYLRFFHLVAAATWLGGIITLGVVVSALRKAQVERPVLVAAARAFARLSWTAMAIAVATGLAQVHVMHLPWSHPPLHMKMGLVAITIAVALAHTRMAKGLRPAARGAFEAALLLLSMGIFAAAIRL